MVVRNVRRASDARLVQAAGAGDARAFEELYERHHAAILAFCRHLTGRLEDAEDAVQHTFFSAYRTIGSGAQLDFRPWLFTVARNRCLSLLRTRRRREASAGLWTGRHGPPSVDEAPAVAWGVEGLSEEVERREDLRALVGDLGALPEPQRAALVLSELDALSHAEVAKVLGVEPPKVRSLVFQARSSLLSTRAARDTPCGEIRVQLSTLRGSSLRQRTLRRHVRACPGCREFEAAVRLQRRELALVLPVVVGASLRDAALPTAVAGGGAGAGGATAATGGAGLAGGTATAAGSGALLGGGGVFSGLVAAVAGGGAAQLTAVAAVAAAGTVGVVNTGVPVQLGLGHAPQTSHQSAPERRQNPVAEPVGGRDTGARTPAPETPSPSGGPDDHPRHSSGGGPPSVPPGLAKKGTDTPPGLAKKEGGLPPGLAKKGGDLPPGQDAERGEKPHNHGATGGNGGNRNAPPRPGPPSDSRPNAPGSRKPPDEQANASPNEPPEPVEHPPPGQGNDPNPPPAADRPDRPDRPR
jgi:RNA polymerase sigma factor (sigma-70 family)